MHDANDARTQRGAQASRADAIALRPDSGPRTEGPRASAQEPVGPEEAADWLRQATDWLVNRLTEGNGQDP